MKKCNAIFQQPNGGTPHRCGLTKGHPGVHVCGEKLTPFLWTCDYTWNSEKKLKNKKETKIFSGNYSRDMWKKINKAKTIEDLKYALYLVCCRLQELESKL